MQSLRWDDACSVTSAARLLPRARLGGTEHWKEKREGSSEQVWGRTSQPRMALTSCRCPKQRNTHPLRIREGWQSCVFLPEGEQATGRWWFSVVMK